MYVYIYLPIAFYSPGAERDFKYPLGGICFGLVVCSPSCNERDWGGLPWWASWLSLSVVHGVRDSSCLVRHLQRRYLHLSQLAHLPAYGPDTSWRVQVVILLTYSSCLIQGKRVSQAHERPFLSIDCRRCRQLPGTHVSALQISGARWGNGNPRRLTWGVSMPEAGSDRTILNAPASSLGSKSARWG